MDTQEDFDFLKAIENTEPDFVRAYLGGIKSDMSKTNVQLTVRQCASLLGVCQNTVLNHIKANKLKAKLVEGQWFIQESDFDSYRSSIVVSKGKDSRSIIRFSKKSKETKVSSNKEEVHVMDEKIRYQKATSRTVTDFLHDWHRNKSSGFSLLTICRDFNQVSANPTNENQMSGILSSLRNKGIVIRKGKGIYQVSPSIVGEIIEDQSHSTTDTTPETQATLIDTDIEQIRTSLKKTERMAVEAFIRNHASPGVDFYFTIADVAREYPHLDRNKLGKACVNMCQTGKLVKSQGLGEYVKQTKENHVQERNQSVKQPSTDSVLEKINRIINSDFEDKFKEELIKGIMQN